MPCVRWGAAAAKTTRGAAWAAPLLFAYKSYAQQAELELSQADVRTANPSHATLFEPRVRSPRAMLVQVDLVAQTVLGKVPASTAEDLMRALKILIKLCASSL